MFLAYARERRKMKKLSKPLLDAAVVTTIVLLTLWIVFNIDAAYLNKETPSWWVYLPTGLGVFVGTFMTSSSKRA